VILSLKKFELLFLICQSCEASWQFRKIDAFHNGVEIKLVLWFLDRAVDLAEKRRLRHQIIDYSDLNNNNEQQKTRPATSTVMQTAQKDAVVLRVDGQMTEASTTFVESSESVAPNHLFYLFSFLKTARKGVYLIFSLLFEPNFSNLDFFEIFRFWRYHFSFFFFLGVPFFDF